MDSTENSSNYPRQPALMQALLKSKIAEMRRHDTFDSGIGHDANDDNNLSDYSENEWDSEVPDYCTFLLAF